MILMIAQEMVQDVYMDIGINSVEIHYFFIFGKKINSLKNV